MPDVKTFSVLDAAKGLHYPTDTVVVYTDVESMYLYGKVDAAINDKTDGNEANELEPELETLREKIKESAQTYQLRGFAPQLRTTIDDEARAQFGDDADLDNGEPFRWRMDKYIAESIVSVTRESDGAVDSSRWSVETVADLRQWLPNGQFDKIEGLMLMLAFQSWEFDRAINADFS